MNLIHHERSRCRGRVADLHRLLCQLHGLLEPDRIAIVELENRRTNRDFVSRLRENHDADRGINRVFDAIAAGPQCHGCAPDELGIQRRQKSAAR